MIAVVRALAVSLSGAMLIGAAGCSDSTSGSSPAPESQPTVATTAPAGATSTPASVATDTFPVTVEHKFGTTTIDAEPERVVTIGWNDSDVVLALGIVPVAYREWFDEYETFPWVVEATGGAAMEALEGEINLEAVAAFEPDLIVDVYDTVDSAMYETLSEIAPTVVQSAGYPDEETPWQDQVRLIGAALGRTELADELVGDLEDAFDAAASAHPEFAEQVLVANFYPDLATGEQWLLGAGDPRRQLFDRLGFQAQDDQGATSAERADLLDRDVLVVNGVTRDEWTSALPTASVLDVLGDDRAVFIDDDSPVSGALAYGSVLSLRYALDELMPVIEAAADGDPATAVTDL
jgi:iron complex transport system substrate-binding protein